MLIKVKTMQTYSREKFKVPVTDTFSIFIACRYLLINGKAINENITIVSEASDHSCIAAFSRINEEFDFIREKQNLSLPVILHIWSDGCACQFWSRFAFSLLSEMDQSVKVNWYYDERHHDNGTRMLFEGLFIKKRLQCDCPTSVQLIVQRRLLSTQTEL